MTEAAVTESVATASSEAEKDLSSARGEGPGSSDSNQKKPVCGSLSGSGENMSSNGTKVESDGSEKSPALQTAKDLVGPESKPNKEESQPEPQVPISAHEAEREQQNSRRVDEAQRYNNRNRGDRRGGHRDGNRGGHNKMYRGNKFDPSSQAESSDHAAIRKQVQFYFSDSNLLTDKFLYERIEGSKNVPVPIDVIHSFKRMQRYQPRSAVVDALKESTTLNVVDDDAAIQRKQPLPEGLAGKSIDEVEKVHEDSSMARSVYVKGFGDEEPKTQFDIEAFFAGFGPTKSVRLRRDTYRTFKGSVFVEFDSEETQKAFLELETKPRWHEKELQIKSKKQYCDEKVNDINAGKLRRNSPVGDQKSYDNKKHDYRDGDNGRDWRQRRNEDADDRQGKGGDRDRKRKGFGSSGRGGRGSRGNNRGGRDRNYDRRARDDGRNEQQDETSTSAINEDAASTAVPTEAPTQSVTSDGAGQSKKRAHETDDADDGQPDVKKVDVKED